MWFLCCMFDENIRIMTAKEKAEELCKKATKPLGYYDYHINDDVKDMALICVDEIIKAEPSRKRKTLTMVGERKIMVSNKSYWKKVKQEINKL